MALFFGASVAIGILCGFVLPWLYDDSKDSDDVEQLNVDVEPPNNGSMNGETLSFTQICITTHKKKTIRFDPEIEIQQLSIQTKEHNDKVSSDPSTEYLSIIFPSDDSNHSFTEIQLVPKMNKNHDSPHCDRLKSSQPKKLGCCEIVHTESSGIGHSTSPETDKFSDNQARITDKSADNRGKTVNQKRQFILPPKIQKPPRAHPPARKVRLRRSNTCPSVLSSSDGLLVQSSQSIGYVHNQTELPRRLNESNKVVVPNVPKLKVNSQETDINQINDCSLYPEVIQIVYGTESSTFVSSSSAKVSSSSAKVSSSSVHEKNEFLNRNYWINNGRLDGIPAKPVRRKNKERKVKFMTEKASFTSSESYENNIRQSYHKKKPPNIFNRLKKKLSFDTSDKDLMKSKSSISSAETRIPAGHSTLIERSSSNSSENLQGHANDGMFRSELGQKNCQLSPPGKLYRPSKMLPLTRATIGSCIIQDLILIHEKSRNKSLLSNPASEMTSTSCEYSRNQSKGRYSGTDFGTSYYTFNGHNNKNCGNNNDSNKNIYEDMEYNINERLTPIAIDNQRQRTNHPINKDANNNSNNNKNNSSNKSNCITTDESSNINGNSWKIRRSSFILNKSQASPLNESVSNKKSTSLPELKESGFFFRWSNFLPFKS